MKGKSAKIPTKLKFRKSSFLLAAIAQVHYGSDPQAPVWAKNARVKFLDVFDFLKEKPEFYRHGYKQAMWDMMGAMMAEEFAKNPQSPNDQPNNAVQDGNRLLDSNVNERKKLYELQDEFPSIVRKTTDIEKRDFYAGKVDARQKWSDGGLSARQKCMFFLATHHEYFDGLTQKETHKAFLELKLIASNTDESQTRTWLGEIGFRSGQRGRPVKSKT